MSFQFQFEESTRPLVSLSYQSVDEDMEVEPIYSVHDVNEGDCDDDIQVIGCYSETSDISPQLAAGRAMTTESADCMSNLSLPETEHTVTESYFSQPSEELIQGFVGNPPSTYARQLPQAHQIAQCSPIDPVPYSLLSPPLINQYPNYDQPDKHNEPMEEHWTHSPHITRWESAQAESAANPTKFSTVGVSSVENLPRLLKKR